MALSTTSSRSKVGNWIKKLDQMIADLRPSTTFFLNQPTSSDRGDDEPIGALLWTQMVTDYPLNTIQEWQSLEGYWYFGNPGLRITQCNESHNVCPSLPLTFVTLSVLSDMKLINTISCQTNGNRVPVVTFATPIASETGCSNFLLRCSTFKDDVTKILYDAIQPLSIIDVASLVPPQSKLESAYTKLRKSCSPYVDAYPRFLSHTGKWLRIISRILSIAREMAYLLREESSLLLLEENDDLFNPILSSLIQVILDPKRRTIIGFEGLLSKDWVHLDGISSLSGPPDIILFTLFLDCVWQLISQNPYHFEFSSLYLIRLYDLQTTPTSLEEIRTTKNISPSEYIQSSPSSGTSSVPRYLNHNRKSVVSLHIHSLEQKNDEKKLLSIRKHSEPIIQALPQPNIPRSLSKLNLNQVMFLYNPSYSPSQSLLSSQSSSSSSSSSSKSQSKFMKNNHQHQIDVSMRIVSDLFLLTLWRPLYLRWYPIDRTYYNYFPLTEFVYFDFLLNKSEQQAPMYKVETSDDGMIESYL
ncbi:myotubularin-related protein 11-like [Brevipalpus obovatus]|uniref:myotubularin-related protein 11-like n=1 Tax=Brevipalpus obovatus TaxID=246614 RepID=UPI003D9F7AC7